MHVVSKYLPVLGVLFGATLHAAQVLEWPAAWPVLQTTIIARMQLDKALTEVLPPERTAVMRQRSSAYYRAVNEWNSAVEARDRALILWGAVQTEAGWFIDARGKVAAHLDRCPSDRLVLHDLIEQFDNAKATLGPLDAERVRFLEACCTDIERLLAPPYELPPILQIQETHG